MPADSIKIHTVSVLTSNCSINVLACARYFVVTTGNRIRSCVACGDALHPFRSYSGWARHLPHSGADLGPLFTDVTLLQVRRVGNAASFRTCSERLAFCLGRFRLLRTVIGSLWGDAAMLVLNGAVLSASDLCDAVSGL